MNLFNPLTACFLNQNKRLLVDLHDPWMMYSGHHIQHFGMDPSD